MNGKNLWNIKLPSGLKNLTLCECNNICGEIREVLIETVSKNGGHLASNLGTVELTLAIHRVFNSPHDKIVWDVGHQAYTHKILTGRLKQFYTLRKENGISGFPKPSESRHDAFISGHSSTSISAACGIARGLKLSGDKDSCAIAVIGDGAFTGGLAYEGLNNAGKSEDNIIIILNHNDMSISKNVGAFARYITNIRTQPTYLVTKHNLEKVLDKTPIIGDTIKNILKMSKSAIKGMLYHNSTMFEDFGFVYLGPVDGHDITELEKNLRIARRLKRPVFVHVNTVKGKGFEPAEKNPGAFHGISGFKNGGGNPEIVSDDSYSAVFGKELTNLADKDKRICAITAAMKYGTGLQYFYAKYKDRFFDVGIAEQHAVVFAAALASTGQIPVFAVYSSFLQRAYDQILHDACIMNTHIVLGIDRAGIVGEDGETHQGVFDVSYLTSMPNTILYSPSCYDEVKLCLAEGVLHDKGVVGIRYPRGADTSKADAKPNITYTLTRSNAKAIAITYGRIYENLCCAVSELKRENKDCEICDMLKLTKIYPIGEDILDILKYYDKIVFFEESMERGGIAEHIAAQLKLAGYNGYFKIKAINGFVQQASTQSIFEELGLSVNGMLTTIRQIIEM